MRACVDKVAKREGGEDDGFPNINPGVVWSPRIPSPYPAVSLADTYAHTRS